MKSYLLFRKKGPLDDDGLPWLRGEDSFEDPAVRARHNGAGWATASFLAVRALLAAADGSVVDAGRWADGLTARVKSRSNPGMMNVCWSSSRDGLRYRIPHGDTSNITYHLPLLWILEAVQAGKAAADFWEAYAAFLQAYRANGKREELKPALVRAADEVYFWGRYHQAAIDKANDRFEIMEVADSLEAGAKPPDVERPFHLGLLTNAAAVRRMLAERPKKRAVATPPTPVAPGRFVGWQVGTLVESLEAGLNVLLAGPTGSGKTRAMEEAVVSGGEARLVTVEGKEGLTDLDFLGAILPGPDGSRRWVDGPLLRAMRLAQQDRVVLFIDEINRIRREYQNLILGLMNPKSLAVCERQGVPAEGEGPFYVIEVPLTSEVVWAPVANLRMVGAGNFGSENAVYAMDPAVRRRFDLILEFDYLDLEAEKQLVMERTELEEPGAYAVCLLAQRTREMFRNTDLPGCIDTGSLLMWARLCARRKAATLADLLALGRLVWADLACGRDHRGLVNAGKFEGLVDYLTKASLKLPPGDLDRLAIWSF